ncbi:MAG: hypothetical protein OCD76_01455 [Reichenbachiella sp.]
MQFKYLLPYLNERFPFVNMFLFVILFMTVMSCSQFATDTAFHFQWLDVLGAVATIGFFFRLRVFDEIKDYDLDCQLHPQRILQSGKIRLKELKVLAYFFLIIELSWSGMMGLNTLLFYWLCLIYSLLMRYEFFISEFLKKRLVLYALSHMMIMPLIILWLWSVWQGQFIWSMSLVILMSLSVLGGFSFELARKIHAPDAEREGQDSYSKALGLKGAVLAVLVVLLLGVLAQFQLLTLIEAGVWTFALIAILYVVALLIYIKGWITPQQSLFRKAELVVSLFMLFSYVTVIIEIVAG